MPVITWKMSRTRFRGLPHLIVMNPSEGRDTGMCVADSALTYH